jgi:hypothetical protein
MLSQSPPFKRWAKIFPSKFLEKKCSLKAHRLDGGLKKFPSKFLEKILSQSPPFKRWAKMFPSKKTEQ